MFENPVSATLVQDSYTHFLDEKVLFSGLAGREHQHSTSIEDVSEWNQDQISRNFIPSGSTKISEYPLQLLLSIEDIYDTRLIMINSHDFVEFIWVVPELICGNLKIIESARVRIWRKLPVRLVETYGELDDPVGLSRVQGSNLPSCKIFAITERAFKPIKLSGLVNVTRLDRGYFLRPLKSDFPE